MTISLSVQSISKSFPGRPVLRSISFDANEHEIIGIAGRNGSGKSTLVKIIGGLLSPEKGTVTLSIGDTAIKSDDYYKHIGYVAPYVPVYDEFTPRELLRITAELRSIKWSDAETEQLMEQVSLTGRLEEPSHGFSSGMMQRLRLATALQHKPSLLILDEPATNLDEQGIAIVQKIVEEQSRRGIVLFASNNAAELEWCGRIVNVESGKQ